MVLDFMAPDFMASDFMASDFMESSARPCIGLFGGTFDPVHFGHLRLALEIKQQLGLAQMRLLPCHRPPHRGQPLASSEQRLVMLQRAVASCPELDIDARELRRSTPSYTYDTLADLRAELGKDVSLAWCMGMDSFMGLESWHRWGELLDLAHLVVVARPGWSLPAQGPLGDLLSQRQGGPELLNQQPAGAVINIAPRLLPIAATEIRSLIARNHSPRFLLPDAVLAYIDEQGLYGAAAAE